MERPGIFLQLVESFIRAGKRAAGAYIGMCRQHSQKRGLGLFCGNADNADIAVSKVRKMRNIVFLALSGKDIPYLLHAKLLAEYMVFRQHPAAFNGLAKGELDFLSRFTADTKLEKAGVVFTEVIAPAVSLRLNRHWKNTAFHPNWLRRSHTLFTARRRYEKACSHDPS